MRDPRITISLSSVTVTLGGLGILARPTRVAIIDMHRSGKGCPICLIAARSTSHNRLREGTEWIALIVGNEYVNYTDVVARDNSLGVFDPSTQHLLVRHDQTDRQIAYFYGSIPDPLPAP